jgi:hypothetical protein
MGLVLWPLRHWPVHPSRLLRLAICKLTLHYSRLSIGSTYSKPLPASWCGLAEKDGSFAAWSNEGSISRNPTPTTSMGSMLGNEISNGISTLASQALASAPIEVVGVGFRDSARADDLLRAGSRFV